MAVIDRIQTSGAALASLLQSMATACADFDGVILGRTQTRTTSTLQDADEAHLAEVREAYITGFCCSALLGSFYTASGDIDVSRLANIAERFPSDSILGWFTFRAGSWPQPSMREVAVCAGLPGALRLLPGRATSSETQPLLFATLATEADHHGATASFRQQFYQVLDDAGRGQGQGSSCRLEPVRVDVLNMGVGSRRGSYEPVQPIAALPRVRSMMKPADAGTSNSPAGTGEAADGASSEQMARSLDDLARRLLKRQVQGMEDMYRGMLEQMNAVVKELADGNARVTQLQRQLAELQQ